MVLRKTALTSLLIALTACGGASRGGKSANGSSEPESRNPFEGAQFYINPDYVQKVETAAAAAPPAEAAVIRKVEA